MNTTTEKDGVNATTGLMSGTWVNQLHSRLTIDHGLGGVLHGTYVTAVGGLTGIEHPMVGFCDEALRGAECPIGFVVRWVEDHSVTSWSGRYDSVSDQITAMWLLTGAARDHDQDWRSTLTGQDTFRRAGVAAS
jgi:hypothetical protein